MEISVQIDDPRWEESLGDGLSQCVHDCCELALSRVPELQGLEQGGLGLTILLADDARVQELNAQFRGKDKPTNVLSFPNHASLESLKESLPDDGYLGDIILAYETVAGEAQEQGKKLIDHLCHLVVHGSLHLLGYDHMDEGDAEVMESLEARILGELSIANPYE